MTRPRTPPPRHARFYADPWRVRVAIRHVDGLWCAVVSPRSGSGPVYTAHHYMPIRAVVRALRIAREAGLPGTTDRWLEWAYEHPQHSKAHDAA